MNRIDRVASEIRHAICRIIQRELKDPRLGFITITEVEVSRDLQIAKVYFTVLGDDKQKKSSQAAIKSAAGFIRGRLGDYLRMRYTPLLDFRLDESVEYGQKIDGIFKKIKEEKKKNVS